MKKDEKEFMEELDLRAKLQKLKIYENLGLSLMDLELLVDDMKVLGRKYGIPEDDRRRQFGLVYDIIDKEIWG